MVSGRRNPSFRFSINDLSDSSPALLSTRTNTSRLVLREERSETVSEQCHIAAETALCGLALVALVIGPDAGSG